MNLSELFIRRPVMTTLVMLSVLVFGIMAYLRLPVSDLPNVDYPTIQVTGQLPGANPTTMATAVATPLEREFSTISGVDSMTSSSSMGTTQIILQFTLNRDIDAAAQDVQVAISRVLRQLPKDMPTPPTFRKVNPADQPILRAPSAVSMGNPHAIFWVDDVHRYDLAKLGPLLEHHPMFPERANISLAQVVSRDRIVLRTWERGAGLTKACGSAACAAAVAAAHLGRTGRTVTVTLPGGDLRIAWREGDDHVLMTGPVEFEYEGKFAPALFAKQGAA